MPGHSTPKPVLEPVPKQVKTPAWQPPAGWDLLTAERLARFRREITPEEAGRFFDGAEPEWSHALCPHLPRRGLIVGLVDRVLTHRSAERPLALLLIGPGGEGKTMALRQTVVDCLAADPNLRVLWRADETASLDPEAIAQSLPKDQGPWLIATDAADLIAAPLHRLLYALRREGRTDVRLLLAARQSDWRAAGAPKLNWRQHADYEEQPLSGLTEPDALVIAASWGHFGDDGAGGSAPALLGRRLFEAARDEAAVDEGALLGGMLLGRKGAGLKDHVHTLLDRLGQTRLDAGGTLDQAFAYIAAMHAEGLDFLSPPVLAHALGCDLRVLRAQVIQPLGREAAAGGGSVLLTRHRRIAQAAVELMRDEFGDDLDGRYEGLARAAVQLRIGGDRVQGLPQWEYDLPQHFLESRPDLAVRIAGAVLAEDSENAHLAVNLARI